MDNFQFWLYVIIGIIYLVSRLRKKSQPEDTSLPRQESRRPSARTQQPDPERTEKPLTFEDLLREITEGKVEKAPERKPEPPVVQRPMYKNYDDEVGEEVESLEDVEYDYRKKNSRYAEYEEGKALAFERPSLEETSPVFKTDMSYGKFKEFEIQTNSNLMSDYLSDLNSPEGLKKAFVLSEILKRKF